MLIADTVREHVAGMLAWIVGGGVFNLFETYALRQEIAEYPGGGQGIAASVTAAAQAMRPIRWPAERLDTLGGYLTYHNILFFQGFLALYAAVQGVHAIRRPEERHSIDAALATGRSRNAYLRDRIVGNAIVIAAISTGLGVSVAASLAFVGAAQTGDALISLASVGLCTLASFAFGLAVAQIARTARTAMGSAVIGIFTIYVMSNEADNLGTARIVRYVAPFEYANRSRALVPGVGWSGTAMLVLVLMFGVLVALATVGFARRDIGAAAPASRRTATPAHGHRRVQRRALRHAWSAALVRHRVAVFAWICSSAGFAALWTSLESTVADAWNQSDFMKAFLGGSAGEDVATLYTSFGCDVLAAIVVAYAASNANGWVADLSQGRVEALLAAPLSWRRLYSHRLIAALIAAGAIATGWLGVVFVLERALRLGTHLDGLLRALIMSLLIAWAAAALAAVLAAWTRRAFASTLLIVYVVVAYSLGWFVQVLHWPDWVNRLSVFSAFGHPYLAWPDNASILMLVVIGIAGSVAAGAIAGRTPKVAG